MYPAKTLKSDSQIGCYWLVWHGPSETEKIDWPHIVIGEWRPEVFQGQTLTIVQPRALRKKQSWTGNSSHTIWQFSSRSRGLQKES
jgi:hypothetical protein